MVDRQFDLDPLALAADLEFDAPRAGDAAAGGDRAGDAAAAAVEQFDIVRAEIQRRLALGRVRRRQPDRTVGEPDLAILDLDREASSNSPMKP